MNTVEISRYLLIAYLAQGFDVAIYSEGFERPEEIQNRIDQSVRAFAERYSINNDNMVDYVSHHLFQALLSENCFEIEKDPIAGEYMLANKNSINLCRESILQQDPIFQRSNKIGPRFFIDAFSRYSDQSINVDDPISIEDLVPASDRNNST